MGSYSDLPLLLHYITVEIRTAFSFPFSFPFSDKTVCVQVWVVAPCSAVKMGALRCSECSGTVHQLFIDFKSAYDSVRKEVFYNILI
jgi:hypothetical protein